MTVKPREVPEGEDDPVENMLKKTGCLELHYKVQESQSYNPVILRMDLARADNHRRQLQTYSKRECIATTKDWRKCQTEVDQFRMCISKHKQEEMTKAKD